MAVSIEIQLLMRLDRRANRRAAFAVMRHIEQLEEFGML
jgi:hypothetical protein